MSRLHQLLAENGWEERVASFETYYAELLKWNRAKQMTTLTEREEVFERHFFDSIALAHARLPYAARLIDIGCGGGFPGFPLKIVRPDLELVAVDSVSKKIAFLNHLRRVLKLENVTCYDRRAEDLGDLFGTFDVVTFRAVAATDELVKIGLPFLRQGGKLLLWKTEGQLDELAHLVDGSSFRVEMFRHLSGNEKTVLVEITPHAES
ncbi:16S rRNA (guanine(527)-N(7))-methyltransferase RsmG [Chrysiogenes arsenatis]|uniref:16S rRNA (guanine(527)-N(7))-methyltransferase RsmG n=1 Tax=Chrysiogenes arsenatis TaxID=309797 RepID=UPI0004257178|nr:16S rRNA (guanine(527)-N(7))-methyltransferase RsmG [Chrysiogenes arsenatis]